MHQVHLNIKAGANDVVDGRQLHVRGATN